MAKQRLFPEVSKARSDDREPHEKFSDLASKIVTVPKSEIDKREQRWQRDRDKSRK